MKGTVELKVTEQETGKILVSNTFKVSGHTTYLQYGRKIADAIKPYMETETVFDVSSTITTDDGETYHHGLSSFKRKGGVVVMDVNPLDMSKKLFNFKSKPPFVWLELIDPTAGEHGSNKWYSLKECPTDETQICANYGRHGDAPGTRWAKHAVDPFMYPTYMYYPKLYEKIIKGYEDHTDERTQVKVDADSTTKGVDENYGIKDADVLHLVKTLMGFANATIKENYSVNVEQVNEKAVVSARKILTRLSKVKTVNTFNKHLLSLMHVIPRRMNTVNDCMAQSKADFGRILSDENDLLDVLENQIAVAKKAAEKSATIQKQSLLDKFDLEIWPATPNQIGKVKSMLNDQLRGKVKNIYRVINKKTQARFDAYLKDNNYPQVREFWHGSRNANWWNIVCQGLLLHSDAPTTGKMFGEGLYFAPSPSKSWGYTSAHGSYWANGNSNTAFMGIYATAHDNPEHVQSYDSKYHYLDAKKFAADYPGKDCLYCHGGTGMLRNDEIVLYKEEQTTINFIVEFEA